MGPKASLTEAKAKGNLFQSEYADTEEFLITRCSVLSLFQLKAEDRKTICKELGLNPGLPALQVTASTTCHGSSGHALGEKNCFPDISSTLKNSNKNQEKIKTCKCFFSCCVRNFKIRNQKNFFLAFFSSSLGTVEASRVHRCCFQGSTTRSH